MQITREQVQQAVYAILRQRAEETILAKTPDEYYGWVPPKKNEQGTVTIPGHWLGEQHETTAKQAVADAEARLAEAKRELHRARYEHDNWNVEEAVLVQATAQLTHARDQLSHVQRVNALAIEKRREDMIERRAKRLFLELYRRATTLQWNLYHPAISQDLRRYIKYWREQPGLTPTSVVFLYIVLLETIAHGEMYQTDAITGYDYMAKIPLVRSTLDVNAAEDEPSRADREYTRALQTQIKYDLRPDAHENGDRRDVLADWQYDGLPEQLGALWLDKNDGHECRNCHEKLVTKTVHNPKGYALAEVCPNHKHKAGCTHRPLTPRFETKTALRDHLCIEWAMSTAA